MLCASFSSFFNLETAAARESALCSGPSCAAAMRRCLAMVLSDEFFQLTRRPVDGSSRGHRPRHAAREVLPRSPLHLQLAVFDDDAAAAQHELRPARIDMALVGRVA